MLLFCIWLFTGLFKALMLKNSGASADAGCAKLAVSQHYYVASGDMLPAGQDCFGLYIVIVSEKNFCSKTLFPFSKIGALRPLLIINFSSLIILTSSQISSSINDCNSLAPPSTSTL